MQSHPTILIVDYGSQYTQVIARTLRELGVRSAVLTPAKASVWLTEKEVKGIILSGGDASVFDKGAPRLPEGVFDADAPILGICYGMQLVVHVLGGKVESEQSHAEYGHATVELLDDPLFAGTTGTHSVWASHRDTVAKLPEGFSTIGSSSQYEFAAVVNTAKRIWGVQFHPEVVDTPCGKDILRNFLFDICGAEEDWSPENIVKDIRSELRERTKDKRAVLGFSGGVDSTVLSAVLAPVFGENLLAVCIDGGHLRKNELEEVKKHADAAGVALKVVDARERFAEALAGVTDAEEKRSRFREVYKAIFEEAIRDWKAEYICQGTLVTDLIESGKTGGALIKTHHNSELGFDIEEIAPLNSLFKYEVRALAAELGLPDSVTHRQPFPGPGLFIRIFGGAVTVERLDILRETDALVRDIVAASEEDVPPISQLVVGLDCSRTVGVKGDSREYGYNVVVRGVHTIDFMTARGVQLPDELRREISSRATQIPGITRVFFDETNKPPATTEFE